MINKIRTNTYSKNSLTFGYGKGLRELVKEAYPYSAYTGKKYSGGPMRITTDHINNNHYGGASKDYNYIFIEACKNVEKGCIGFRKYISKHLESINHIANYFEALHSSPNPRIRKYAQSASDTVLTELSGIHCNIADRKIILPKTQ